jgi:hypothetical protein
MTSIVKCTIKKSVSVTKKLIKWGSISAGILAGFAAIIYFLWSMRDIMVFAWNSYLDWNEFCYSILASIPWFVWVIIAIPCSIIGYSYLWCYNKQHNGIISNRIKRMHLKCLLFYMTMVSISVGLLGGLICLFTSVSFVTNLPFWTLVLLWGGISGLLVGFVVKGEPELDPWA